MSLATNRRFRQAALPLVALICLSSCSAGQETQSSYDDISEYEAKPILGEAFILPTYYKSTLFDMKKLVQSGKTTTTASFHTDDSAPTVSDNYTRRLRIDNWVVTDIEKADTKADFKAYRGKGEECKVAISNDGTKSTVVITVTAPK
jgi:hypothetical protein